MISLYDCSVGTYLQILRATAGILEKGRQHFASEGVDLADIVAFRLREDMLPFWFQIVSVCHHSLGAIRGIQAGVFSPPPRQPDLTYEMLEEMVKGTLAGLESISVDEVDSLEGKDMQFKMGDTVIPFTAENFILSFSLPNFYFHAATTYDILRMKGVPLGKRDFLGRLRIKR
jgi:hypothetical protein